MIEVSERIEQLLEHAAQYTGAKVYYREDWQCHYFELAGKQFGRIGDDPQHNKIITLKGEPLKNEELRSIYSSVKPGYYANKNHWNSIELKTSELSTTEIQKQIEASYYLVFNKLTKAEKSALEAETNSD